MAAPNHVPSRLVINTLRGVIFTTSCSVVLLAEERRRRIKIARAAVENARKLHTARASRGAIALGDGFVSWDGKLLDSNDDILATLPLKSTRRRRTASAPSAQKHSLSQNIITTKNDGKRPKPIQHILETSHIEAAASAVGQAIRLPSFLSTPQHTHLKQRLKITVPTATNALPTTHSLEHAELETATNSLEQKIASLSVATNGKLSSQNEASSIINSNTETSTQNSLMAEDATTQHPHEEAMFMLEALLGEFEAGKVEMAEMTEKLQLTLSILHQIKLFTPQSKEASLRLRIISLRLVEFTTLQQPNMLQPVLDQVLELSSNNPQQIFEPYLRWLVTEDNKDGVELLAAFLANAGNTRRYLQEGKMLARIFQRHSKSSSNMAFNETKKLFQWLQETGIITQMDDCGGKLDFDIRRQLILQAQKAHDYEWIMAQMDILNEIHPTETKADKRLQKAYVISQTSLTRRPDLGNTEGWLGQENAAADSSIGQQTGIKMGMGTTTSLQIAVLSRLKQDNGQIEGASQLINEAQARGEDISEALTPVLINQLKNPECNVNEMLNETIHRGARVHDSVFNKAAQNLTTIGDFRGAANVCELAAKQNGFGQLGYNEYNFANLVFIYTGCARYDALQSLLTEFRAQFCRWRGSKVCKESIKLAMKTTAQRAINCADTSNSHHRALEDLDESLCHVKRCRISVRSSSTAMDNTSFLITMLSSAAETGSKPGSSFVMQKNIAGDILSNSVVVADAV